MDPILLVGAGGHARACIDVIEQEARFSIKGLVGLPYEVGSSILGYPVLGADEDLPALISDCVNVLVAIGQIKTPEPRLRVFDFLSQNSAVFPIIISPRAYVSVHAKLNSGTIVMHGAVINAGVKAGKNCIINSQALVEHDAIIGDHCHISTSAIINSGVFVGKGTFIGSNSSVRQGINIGENCLIGMGQNVLADCETGARIV